MAILLHSKNVLIKNYSRFATKTEIICCFMLFNKMFYRGPRKICHYNSIKNYLFPLEKCKYKQTCKYYKSQYIF